MDYSRKYFSGSGKKQKTRFASGQYFIRPLKKNVFFFLFFFFTREYEIIATGICIRSQAIRPRALTTWLSHAPLAFLARLGSRNPIRGCRGTYTLCMSRTGGRPRDGERAARLRAPVSLVRRLDETDGNTITTKERESSELLAARLCRVRQCTDAIRVRTARQRGDRGPVELVRSTGLGEPPREIGTRSTDEIALKRLDDITH